ncbi:MAG: formate dehydrogenase [Alphaproteobacteria bacterium]|nr:formate dehydrogenase [Alphaproteobacteria bacterium]
MQDKPKSKQIARRAFFRTATVGATAAGVAALGLSAPKAQAQPGTEGSSAGYRETDHVKRVYALSRF